MAAVAVVVEDLAVQVARRVVVALLVTRLCAVQDVLVQPVIRLSAVRRAAVLPVTPPTAVVLPACSRRA